MGINKHICYLCGNEDTFLIGLNPDFNTDIYKCNECGLIQNDFVSNIYLTHYYYTKYRKIRKETITDKYLEFMDLRAISQEKFIKNSIDKNFKLKNIIDIGAGAGRLIKRFEDESTTLFALESDINMIEYISKNTKAHIIDYNNLFKDTNRDKFSLVLMSHVFEHINNPIEYLFKLYNIIEDGGYLFIEVPNEPLELINHHLKKNKKGIGHLFDYTYETIQKMIKKSSLFDIVKIGTFGISVEEYIKGKNLKNFDRNGSNNGVYIRIVLRKKNITNNIRTYYQYIDNILENRYIIQLRLEKSIEELKAKSQRQHEWIERHKPVIEELKAKSQRQHEWIERHKSIIKELKIESKKNSIYIKNLQKVLNKKNKELEDITNSRFYKFTQIILKPIKVVKRIFFKSKEVMFLIKTINKYDIFLLSDNYINKNIGSELPIHNMLKETNAKKNMKIVYTNDKYGNIILLYLFFFKNKIIVNGIRTLKNKNVLFFAKVKDVKIYFHETDYVFQRLLNSIPQTMQTIIALMQKREILCVSYKQKKYFEEIYNAKKCTVIYNCIPKIKNIKNNNLFDEKYINILMVGSIQERKGVTLFSNLADYCMNKNEKFRFHWLGKRAFNEKVYLSNNVNWIGYKDNPQDYIISCDIMFLSSIDDPFPLSCLEALMLYKKVIVFKEVGTSEIIKDIDGCGVFNNYTVEDAYNILKQTIETELDKDKINEINTNISSCIKFKNRIEKVFL